MITLEHLQGQQRGAILAIAAKYNATNLRVFGSVARGEATPESDVDFLVEMPPGQSLLKRIALQQELEALLGCSVDVVKPNLLHEHIRERVLQEAVRL